MGKTITPVSEAVQVNGIWFQDYSITDDNGNTTIKKYKHNGVDWVEASEVGVDNKTNKIDFTKHIPETTAGISLKKNVVNLDKCLVNLSKSSGINLEAHSARVAVVMDFSGSMNSLYRNGAVQRTLNRLVPLGLRFDDNGELDVWLFHTGYKRLEGLELGNFEQYVNEVMLNAGEKFGGTSYAPVLEDVLNKYINEEPSKYPAFVIFITDGATSNKKAVNELIKKSSNYNVFIQFIGLGKSSGEFDYLRRLDELQGRPVDNTGFMEVRDFDSLTDDELYSELLEQYIDWLKATGIR